MLFDGGGFCGVDGAIRGAADDGGATRFPSFVLLLLGAFHESFESSGGTSLLSLGGGVVSVGAGGGVRLFSALSAASRALFTSGRVSPAGSSRFASSRPVTHSLHSR